MENQLKDRMTNFGEEGDTVENELNPPVFVAVPSDSVKDEELNDQPIFSRVCDPLCRDLEEVKYNIKKERNVVEDGDFLSGCDVMLGIKRDCGEFPENCLGRDSRDRNIVKRGTKCSQNLMKYGEGSSSLQENCCQNFSAEEKFTAGELHPVTFVAVLPVSLKYDELHNLHSLNSCARDPLLPDPHEEPRHNSDLNGVKKIKEEREFLSDSEIKLEVEEYIDVDETINSIHSEDGIVKGSDEVEIKSESICDVCESDVKEEKPIKTCLEEGMFEEEEKSGRLASEERNEALKCGIEESLFIGNPQGMNETLDCGHENQVEKDKDPIATVVMPKSNSGVAGEDNNSGIYRKCRLTNSEINPRIKENGLQKHFSYICTHCDVIFSEKILYNQNLSGEFRNNSHIEGGKITAESNIQKLQQSPGHALKNKSMLMTFSCPICKNLFSKKKFVELNVQNQNEEKHFSCRLCDKSFDSKTLLDSHSKCHPRNKPYACRLCEKSFSHKSTLNAHMISHTRDIPFNCNLCKKSFSYKSELNTHMRSHTGDKLFPCGQCEKSFIFKSQLNTHMQYHTGNYPFSCGLCEKSFTYQSRLNAHMLSHSKDKQFACCLCDKSFAHKSELNTHMLSHTGGKPFACSVCEKLFVFKSQLNIHVQSHTRDYPFSCGLCDKSFIYKSKLDAHMLSHSGGKLIACGLCHKSFAHESGLNTHMLFHTGDKPFASCLCEKSFSHKLTPNANMISPSRDIPFNCDLCKKSFSCESGLNTHMLSHTGDKPYACGLCEKSFIFKSQLNTHMQSHTGDNPCSCHLCEKSFPYKSKLKAHMLSHSRDKPFACCLCEKSFRHKSTRKLHMRSHTSDPLACDVCKKSFSSKSNLIVHMRSHTGDKPLACSM